MLLAGEAPRSSDHRDRCLRDALDRVRRQQPRTAAAEIIWGLLPPLTAGTDVFTIAGLLEPTYAIGGDAFDYNLAETSASLAISTLWDIPSAPL